MRGEFAGCGRRRLRRDVWSLAVGGAPAPAPASDALVGGIIGGVVGGMVSGAIQRDQQRTAHAPPRPARRTVSSATREANREMQTALNYFSFPAGTPDGVVGRNTRNAVAQYQAFMGYPATGELTPVRAGFPDHLLPPGDGGRAGDGADGGGQPAGHARASAAVPRRAGPRRDDGGGPVPPAASPGPARAAGRGRPGARPAPAPAPVEAAPALPNFMGTAPLQASLASHCNRVSLVTNTNGGFTTLAAMTDPEFVLEEQFCLARTYAIADGEEMAARVPGHDARRRSRSNAPASARRCGRS
jgi:peptidoglycan hydrolase-like protein with peptidoglycan-binding domain